jgi:hypothetical protein
MDKSTLNLIIIFLESEDPINSNSKGIYCWDKTDVIQLNQGVYFYRDVKTNFYDCYVTSDGSYFVGKPYELGKKIFYKNVNKSNYCISCGVDMGPMNPRQYCCKTYCSNENY